ncbi:hypothetical protein HH1059_11790 [Halorhodospira halochloris]|uniref:EAL domain-containing protein n=1 Tax=Halorhodospira halochloris TaxID=1052 RepID=A0A2Z6EZG3_HALHR|nr:hypothetical protein HH1059_11790 [Halorhodospira halochloris]
MVLEGVETEHQALTALYPDVDFVQGFFFARPISTPRVATDLKSRL